MRIQRQVYIPPGAGKNFISLQCLWLDDKRMTVHFKEHVNEYAVHSQKSTLFPFHLIHIPDDLPYALGSVSKFEKQHPSIATWASNFRKMLSKKEFIELAREYGASSQGIEIFNRDWYWMPIFDYSIYFYIISGKNKKLDEYLKGFMNACWDVHNMAKKELTSIIHYSPDNTIDFHITKKEIQTMCISFKDCEEYISDLLYVKHSTPSPWIKEDIPPEERFFIKDQNIKADVDISYTKIFKETNINELRRLYRFFGHEDYFNSNAHDIVDKFKAYHNFNENLIKSFDFSNVPLYDMTFNEAWEKKFK